MKLSIGSLWIWILSIVPIFIWLIVRVGTNKFNGYSVFTHSLGQLSGLVGMTMFALTFILTTRLWFIEKYFGGLDKGYKVHHSLGVFAFVLILFHPILLVLNYIPSNINIAAIYFIPSSDWPINFGIIALAGFIILIILTIFAKIAYQKWKFTHKFMGLVFLIACFHVFFVPTDISLYPILRYYMLAVSAIGLISYVYDLKNDFFKKGYRYKVVAKESLGDKVNLIKLVPINQKMNFKAGQFVFLKFLDSSISQEEHPFTIASAPKNGEIVFAIKSLGDWTSDLKNLKQGVIAEIDGPYGKFCNSQNSEQIWIAGGIGITPFLSMAEEFARGEKRMSKIDLYYCIRNREEAVFLPKLQEMSKKLSGKFRVIPYFSENNKRISAKEIIKTSGNLQSKAFMICGPSKMMYSLNNQIKAEGVKSELIKFEDFSLK
ncbi:MAG: ferric reductase-like transmembrane domain-containing protein [Nanoarchaeota archaeon]